LVLDVLPEIAVLIKAKNDVKFLTKLFLQTIFKRKMFGLFKKKSKEEILQEKYKNLLKESFELSKTNRAASDKKQAEAQAVLDEIEVLKAQKGH